MSNWKETTLGECAKVRSGFAFKSRDFQLNGIPVVKIKNVNKRCVDITETQFFPEEAVTEKHASFFLEDGDVLIAMTGQGSVGRVGRLSLEEGRKVLLNQRVGKFEVKDKSKLDLQFLFYIISSPYYEKLLFDLGTGSGQPNLSPSLIGTVKLNLVTGQLWVAKGLIRTS